MSDHDDLSHAEDDPGQTAGATEWDVEYRTGPVMLRGSRVPGTTTDQRLLDSRGPTEAPSTGSVARVGAWRRRCRRPPPERCAT